jgi:hypothetical protein
MRGIAAGSVADVIISGNVITENQNTPGDTRGIEVTSTHTSLIDANRIKITYDNTLDWNYILGIATGSSGVSETISNNILDNCSVNSAGAFYFISSNSSAATVNIINNYTQGTTTKTGTSAFGVTVWYGNAGLVNITGNNFSTINLGNNTYLSGIDVSHIEDRAAVIKIINNSIVNITGSSSGIDLMMLYNEAITEVKGNTLSHVNSNGYVNGILILGAGSRSDISNNYFHSITVGSGHPTYRALNIIKQEKVIRDVYGDIVPSYTNIYQNKIHNLQFNGTTGSVAAIEILEGRIDIINNLIADLRAPLANEVASTIKGIHVACTVPSTINASYNTIYLDAVSSGTDFSASGVFQKSSSAATNGSLTLINNIIINKSVPNGNGFASAIRCSSDDNGNLANFSIASDNNLLYAGTPSPKHLIYTDSIFFAQTLNDYQTATYTAGTMAPRDARSVTEASTPFLSLAGNNPGFLHLDPSVATVAEGGGRSLASVATDFDGNTRNATPDIGADEFTGLAVGACNGTPVAGTITGPATTCSLDSITLQLSGQSVGNGITVQWAYATTPGGPYTIIPGASGLVYNTGSIPGGARYYVAMVTCAHTGTTVISPEFTVTSAAAYHWTGAIDTHWENPGNWTCGIVPYGDVAVVINSGTVLVSSHVWIGSLQLGPGVNFTVGPGYQFYIAHL